MAAAEDKDKQNFNSFQTNHVREFFLTLNEMRREGINTDVILVCKEKEFPAHQLVLSAGSPYFKTMFESDFRESSSKRVDFSHVNEHILKAVLEFLYLPSKHNISGESVENLSEIHALSHLFSMNHLADLCWDLITKQVNIDSCLLVWKVVRIYKDIADIDRIEEYLLNNLQYIIHQEAFLSLNSLELKLILQKIQETDYQTGDDLLEAIVNWTKFDKERKNNLLELCSYLNFDFTSEECMEQIQAVEPHLFKDPHVRDFMQFIVKPKLKPKHILEEIFQKTSLSHSLVKRGFPPVRFFFFGNYKNYLYRGGAQDEYPAIWTVDIQNKTNPTLKWLPFRLGKKTVCTHSNFNFYFVGDDIVNISKPEPFTDSPKQHIFLYDWKSNTIKWKLPLPKIVNDLHACALHNKIYIIGKSYSSSSNSSALDIQYFDLSEEYWKTIYSSQQNCKHFQCITTKERIYIFCETEFQLCEMFEVIDDTCSHLFTFSYSQENISPKMNTVHKNEIFRFVSAPSGHYTCHVHSPYTLYSSFHVTCNASSPMKHCFSTEAEGIFFYNDENNLFHFDKDKHEIKKLTVIQPKISAEKINNCSYTYDILMICNM